MNKSTLKALKKSIKHWERNVEANYPWEVSISAYSCALCLKFALAEQSCKGCPVFAVTAQSNCFGTPYYLAKDVLDEWSNDPKSRLRALTFKNVAQAELDFLRSLLPAKSQKK